MKKAKDAGVTDRISEAVEAKLKHMHSSSDTAWPGSAAMNRASKAHESAKSTAERAGEALNAARKKVMSARTVAEVALRSAEMAMVAAVQSDEKLFGRAHGERLRPHLACSLTR